MKSITFHEIAFTLPIDGNTTTIPEIFRDFFGIDGIDLATIKQPLGRNGYSRQYVLKGGHGGELVTILAQGKGRNLEHTTNITIHGAALESGSFDVQDIAIKLLDRGGWGARAHLALDDHGGVLPWEEIKTCCEFGNYRDRLITRLCRPSKDRQTGQQKENEPYLLKGEGETVYLGRRSSDTSLVLYNRRGPLRCELRLAGRGQVTDLLTRIAAGEPLGPLATGILKHNLVFVEPGPQSRKDRRPVCSWWLTFCDNAEALALTRKRQPKQRSPWYVPISSVERTERSIRKKLEGPRRIEYQAMFTKITYDYMLGF